MKHSALSSRKEGSPLQELPIFSSLGANTVTLLTRQLPRRDFARSEHLIRQGERGTKAFLLFDGKVAINVESSQNSHSLAFRAAPNLLGFIELGHELPYLANVVAIEPCSALELDRQSYLKMLHSNHQVCINLVQYLADLIYQTGKDRDVRLFGQVENLLANTLCYFAELYGEPHTYGILIRREINKSELASLLGVARRSIIRGLASLEKEGLVSVEKKLLVIADLKALQKKAHWPAA